MPFPRTQFDALVGHIHFMRLAPAIPAALGADLRGYVMRRDLIGESDDHVFRFDAPSRPSLIAKIFERANTEAAEREAARLRWLPSAGAPAPRLLTVSRTATHDWLLMECLPGTNAADSSEQPAIKVRCLAHALKQLHALPIETCPFDETLAVKLGRAKTNVHAGIVDELDFDADHHGLTAEQLFARLTALVPPCEDLVVAHGDASLPNFMLDRGLFAGFVDCGRLGRSDRYQDLAICCNSIEANLGSAWIAPFLQAYGPPSVDEKRMRFYRMLDEFF
jgi:aminoglycoside 3'-phosphotransferase-2